MEEFDSPTLSIVVSELSGADPVVMANKRLPWSPMKIGWVSVNFPPFSSGGVVGGRRRVIMRLAYVAERASFLIPDADRPDCNRCFPNLVPRSIVRSRGGRGAEYPEPTEVVICPIPRQREAKV